LLWLLLWSCGTGEPPAAYGPVPSPKQVEWQRLEFYMFVHFGPNTFSDVEWGSGEESPDVFCPDALDCRQWAATAKQAGMKGIILTAKHHDGFCLWPSRLSSHTVRQSCWRNGQGDVLRELSQACREYGLAFGVYLSPWDRNHPAYKTPAYNGVFADMLREVLSNYGEVFEQWFDGANGESDKGRGQAYDWPLFRRTVYACQPHAMIFSDVGPDCRWVGNESGEAGLTNWSTLDTAGFSPGWGAPPTDSLATGNINGPAWIPAEADVSIRPGWFYSPATDNQQKSVDLLMRIYFASVGRNANLLLNVPPDRHGRIHPNDSLRLMEFRRMREQTFAVDLLQNADLQADDTRSPRFAAKNLLNDRYHRYWATRDGITQTTIDIRLPSPQRFNCLLLQEYIPLGQRITSFTLERRDQPSNAWQTIACGTTIGYKRILTFPDTTAQHLRLRLHAQAPPTLTRLALYHAPNP